ncbi:unnamed protein product [Durusdinium trenchii]|uniref:Sugar phosphate transporter domain-containing protein n=1 Tax=Durusdinium trenchii TaxID=1381693 RepID=A0ABP0LC98_9DINO
MAPSFLDMEAAPEKAEKEVPPRMPPCLRVFVIVLFNFTTSIMLVNSVKCLYDLCGFKFPLFIASMHMVFSWMATAMFGASPDGEGQVLLPMAERIRKVLPFTILQAASIACSNLALTYLYPSYHEMVQSLTPLFTLTVSVLLEGKRYNCWAYWAMIPVCGGGAICSFNEVNFSLIGSMLSISAVVFRALKTMLQGRLLCEQKVDSITLCYYMSPFNLAILGTASALTEGWRPWRMLLTAESSFAEHSYLLMSLTVSSILACAFNILSYLTIKHLSPVGANVMGNAKTPAIIFFSMLIFGNAVAPLQVLGLIVTFCGIFLHAQKGRVVNK